MKYLNTSPTPWTAQHGRTIDVIIDRDDDLICAACPIDKRERQRANIQLIVDRVNGPLLPPERFFKERNSGRVQVGSKWNAEFEEVCDREFFEVDLSEEIG